MIISPASLNGRAVAEMKDDYSSNPFLNAKKTTQSRRSSPVDLGLSSCWFGKTYVLAQRVLRLLLTGVPPSHILCLTYTKAAAANMSARVSENLAKWVLLDDIDPY